MNRGPAILQRGFTLVELLIVVIILAILAAIVVPQFAVSTDEAKVSSLDSTLVNMRGAIDLYYRQHGKYPSAAAASGGTCTGGTAGAGDINTSTAFIEQLSMYTDASGKACSIGDDTTYKYGPYLKKATIPTNPVTGSNALVVVTAGNLALTGTGAGLGWLFDNKAGKFIANDTNSSGGVRNDSR
jgi:prepilin-type N-terminal cleavage/methylation domain-containing protein